MAILTKLEYLPNLTNAERKLANYILDNPLNIVSMSLEELALKSNCSNASIYRLCTKLDISGYNELRFLLAKEADSPICSQIDFNVPFTKNNTDYEVMTSLETLYRQTVLETKDLLDLNTLRHCTNLLDKAHRINIYTSSNNVQIAENFQYKMSYIDKIVSVLTINYQQELEAIKTNEHTVSIILSYSGKNKDLLRIIKLLKQKNRRIILISSILDNTFDKYCDFHLYLCPREDCFKERISTFSSHISAQYVMDVLFSLIFKTNYDENHQNIGDRWK